MLQQLKSTLRFLAAKFIDPHGRELPSPPRKPDTDMLGLVRIRDQWSTYPSANLTPEKLASIWREADNGDILRQAELAEEMEEKEPELQSLLQTRKLAVLGLKWEVEPASDSAEDGKIAEHVRKNLQDLKLRKPLLHLMDAVFKGFSTVEINWQVSSGQAWAGALEQIPQKRWTFNEYSKSFDDPVPKLPRLLTTSEPLRGIEVPAFKVLYHQSTARSGLPQRGGLFRPCAWYYLFKNFGIKDWVIFLEKFGQPLRLGKYQPGASADDIKILKEAVKALGVDAGAVIPDTTLLEMLEYKGTSASSDLYERFAVFVNKSWQKCILGQTASSEGTPGSLGDQDTQDQVRQDLIEADAEDLSDTIRDQLIWPMVGWNFGWEKMLPHFRFLVERPKNLVELSTTHRTLVEIGVPIPVSYMRKTYAIPEPVGDEAILEPRMQFPSPFQGEGQGEGAFGALRLKKKVPIGSRLVSLNE